MDNQFPTPQRTEENPDDTRSKITEEKAKDTVNRTTQEGTDDMDESSSACPGTSGSNKKRKLSDSENRNTKKVVEEIKMKEETFFMDLITNAAEILMIILGICRGSLHEAKATVIKSFQYSKGKRYKDIDFTKPENLIGYFTRNGPTSAGVARFKISKILDENEGIRNRLENFTSPIKILDLGTGHGCGILGLCSSLNKYLKKKDIHLTLVDHVKEWVPVFNAVEFLLKSKNFGQAFDFFQNNNIYTNYLVFDLSREANEHVVYERSLSEANVVVISRVFSIEEENYQVIAENVVKGMEIGALLIFIDAMGYLANPFTFPNLKENLKELASECNQDYEFKGTIENDYEVSKGCRAQCFVYRKI